MGKSVSPGGETMSYELWTMNFGMETFLYPNYQLSNYQTINSPNLRIFAVWIKSKSP